MLLQLGTLPEAYSDGAKKAWAEMATQYGPEEGRRIFVQKAVERGRGKTIQQIVDSVYKTGATVPTKKQAIVDVRLNRERPAPPTVRIKRVR